MATTGLPTGVSAARLARFTLLVWALAGCPKPAALEEDPLIQKLQAEKERLARQRQPPAPAEPVARPLPSPNPAVQVGAVALKLTELSAQHSVQASSKLTLTSEEGFVRLGLLAQNAGRRPQTLDFALSHLERAGQLFEVAKDAQRLAGTRELQLELQPGQRVEVVMYFEVPVDARSGLSWVLPPAAAGAGETRIPLE